jgi:hypothetical protein
MSLVRHIRSHTRLLIVLLVAVAAATTWAVPALAFPPDEQNGQEIFGGDTFVLDYGALRPADDTTAKDAELYNVVGTSLGFTWGVWRQAKSVSSRAQQSGRRTEVRIKLTGLIPNGVYSVFYTTFGPDSASPACPGVERSLPLTSYEQVPPGPDASSFVAGPDGTATYRGRVERPLLDAGELVFSVIYHADGQAYDPFPNRGEQVTAGPDCRSSFGADAMRQLLIIQKAP